MLQKYILFLVQGVKSKQIFHFFFKLKNIYLYILYHPLKNKSKIIYVLTPPSQLPNIGDHAQVVAIKQWLKDSYENIPIVEFNKDETIHLQWIIKKITNHSDLIFIHSGGNMGDSGLWSEKGRRLTIKNFPQNKIISLPQTIHFSDSIIGEKELKVSRDIYNSHTDLTIIARDLQSEILAKQYFQANKIFACPDFVLYLLNKVENHERNNTILYCLRNDSESAIATTERNSIISNSKYTYKVIDTTLPYLIARKNRKKEVNKILFLIGNAKAIVTDRYHGLIFAVLTKTPCVVLPTFNHKLTSAFKWFDGINYIRLAKSKDQIPDLIEELNGLSEKTNKNWRKLYFNSLKKQITT